MSTSILPAPLTGIPWRVLLPLTLLVCFGAAVLYSAAGGSFQPYALSHLIRFAVFLAMAFVISRFPRDLVQFGAYPAYGVVVVLLMTVEAIGAIGGGAQRWIDLGFMQLQPSEFMKPTIVLVLAMFYHSVPPGLVGSWRALVPAAGMIGFPMALVLLQPDLGTALANADGLVNATPAGMSKYPGLPVPSETLHPGLWVADVVYFPEATALLGAARHLGCRTLSGRGMAIFQAVRDPRARELDNVVLQRASFVCCDSREQSRLESGDLIEPVAAGVLDWLEVHELQEVVAGEVGGRASERDVVVFKSNGIAPWDVAAGVAVLEAVSRYLETLEGAPLSGPEVDLNAALVAVVVLGVAGAVASIVPARHAARVAPVEALRAD